MPIVWTTDKIINIDGIKYRLKTPIKIELRGRSMGDIDIVIPYVDKETGYEGNYYFPDEGNLDNEIIDCIQRNRYCSFFKEHLELFLDNIPTNIKIQGKCLREGCKQKPETYFICNKGKSKFPICFKHHKELIELISRL